VIWGWNVWESVVEIFQDVGWRSDDGEGFPRFMGRYMLTNSCTVGESTF
jgi:hypothetical protein